ncbi:uncharacterized protein LOC142322113 [Lycorma delicatula]|uniref:uncharacterized protein LOC142322113 n=1 Tax=Lycorma delicatula TaxID=130591 RepID=UPI003F50DEE7
MVYDMHHNKKRTFDHAFNFHEHGSTNRNLLVTTEPPMKRRKIEGDLPSSPVSHNQETGSENIHKLNMNVTFSIKSNGLEELDVVFQVQNYYQKQDENNNEELSSKINLTYSY